MTIPRNEQPPAPTATKTEARPPLCRLFPANGCHGLFDFWLMNNGYRGAPISRVPLELRRAKSNPARRAAFRGLDKAHGQGCAVRSRRISECCRRSSKPRRDHRWAPLIRKSRWPASPLRGDAGPAAFTPAKTAFRLRKRRRSRKPDHRAGHARIIGQLTPLVNGAPAKVQGFAGSAKNPEP